MASQNLERVSAVYRDWARGDFRAGQDLLAPDVAFITFTGEGDELEFQGPEAVADWMRDFLLTWRDLRVEAERLVELDDSVLAIGHQTASGRQSGVTVGMPLYTLWTFRDGRVVRLHHARERARLGLPIDD